MFTLREVITELELQHSLAKRNKTFREGGGNQVLSSNVCFFIAHEQGMADLDSEAKRAIQSDIIGC